MTLPWLPANQRMEAAGGQLCYFMRTPVAAGRSCAGCYADLH